jgi:hypothetical protein
VSEQETLRGYLRRDLMQAGFPPAMADETLDLAWHASDSAMETLCSVTERGVRPVVRENALSIALTLTHIRAQAAIDQVAKQFASDGLGHQVSHLAVTAGR